MRPHCLELANLEKNNGINPAKSIEGQIDDKPSESAISCVKKAKRWRREVLNSRLEEGAHPAKTKFAEKLSEVHDPDFGH